MSEMVQRVADHLRRKVGPAIDPSVCEMAAKIAIEAMREPTQAMVGVADVILPDLPWREMIDEALR